VSIVWTAQTSCAEYTMPVDPPGCMVAWNPTKPSHHSSLVECYL